MIEEFKKVKDYINCVKSLKKAIERHSREDKQKVKMFINSF